MTKVWIDGDLVDSSDAHVPALSVGVLTGTGVFESMKVVDRDAFALRRHLRRLGSSAALVGISLPGDDVLRGAVRSVLDATADATRVRITVCGAPVGNDRPTVFVHAEHTSPWAPTSHIITSPWVRNERAASTGAKTTSYVDNVLAMRHARQAGADEAILCDTRGFLSEGTASNVFLSIDGRLCTPSLANGCLGGMTRELLCELVEVDEREDLSIVDLRRADEVFVTSSTRDVHPVATIDGQPVTLVPGPLTVAAAQALTALQHSTLDP